MLSLKSKIVCMLAIVQNCLSPINLLISFIQLILFTIYLSMNWNLLYVRWNVLASSISGAILSRIAMKKKKRIFCIGSSLVNHFIDQKDGDGCFNNGVIRVIMGLFILRDCFFTTVIASPALFCRARQSRESAFTSIGLLQPTKSVCFAMTEES